MMSPQLLIVNLVTPLECLSAFLPRNYSIIGMYRFMDPALYWPLKFPLFLCLLLELVLRSLHLAFGLFFIWLLFFLIWIAGIWMTVLLFIPGNPWQPYYPVLSFPWHYIDWQVVSNLEKKHTAFNFFFCQLNFSLAWDLCVTDSGFRVMTVVTTLSSVSSRFSCY